MPERPARAATARRSAPPPPAKKQGNPVLVIFLVFFILISLVLGVFLYLAQDKIATATAEAGKQKQAADAAQKAETNIKQYFLPKIRSWYDLTGVTAQDLQSVRDLNDKFAQDAAAGNDPRNDADLRWFVPMMKMMEGDPNGKDDATKIGLIGPLDPQGKPSKSLKGELDTLRQAIAQRNKDLEGKQRELAEKVKEYDDYKARYNEAAEKKLVQSTQTRYETQIKQLDDDKKKQKEAFDAELARVERDVAKQIEDLSKASTNEKKRMEDTVREVVDNYEKKAKVLQEKAVAKRTLNLDKPQGKVVRVDAAGEMIYIDIGSDQQVQPQLTFALHGVGPGGKPLPEAKARIEVISVLGKNLSQARVTRIAKPEFARTGNDPTTGQPYDPSLDSYWITDPKKFWNSRTPVVTGDLLYNQFWNPKEPVHVVLAGDFDMDGDGHNDVDHFKRVLTGMGIVVDGYLDTTTKDPDTNEFKLKGKLNYQTDYVVVGSFPLLSTGAGVKPLAQQATEASGGVFGQAVAKVQEQALLKGVQVVSLKTFLTRMGFTQLRLPNPKSAATEIPIPAGNGAKPADGAGAPGAGGAKKEEEEEPKKKP